MGIDSSWRAVLRGGGGFLMPTGMNVHGGRSLLHGQDMGNAQDHRKSIEQWLAVGCWRLVVNGWQLALGVWWRLAVGRWQLLFCGGWRLVVGGSGRLVVGSWRLPAIGSWQLAVGGGWRLVVPRGYP